MSNWFHVLHIYIHIIIIYTYMYYIYTHTRKKNVFTTLKLLDFLFP